MQIETEFNIGDDIITIHNDEIDEGTVDKVFTETDNCSETKVSYLVKITNSQEFQTKESYKVFKSLKDIKLS